MQVLRLRPGYWPSISLKLCFEMQTFPRRSVIATACADRSQNIFAPTDSGNKAAVEAHPNLAQNARFGWGTRHTVLEAGSIKSSIEFHRRRS